MLRALPLADLNEPERFFRHPQEIAGAREFTRAQKENALNCWQAVAEARMRKSCVPATRDIALLQAIAEARKIIARQFASVRGVGHVPDLTNQTSRRHPYPARNSSFGVPLTVRGMNPVKPVQRSDRSDWDRAIERQLLRLEQVRIHLDRLDSSTIAADHARRNLTQMLVDLKYLQVQRLLS